MIREIEKEFSDLNLSWNTNQKHTNYTQRLISNGKNRNQKRSKHVVKFSISKEIGKKTTGKLLCRNQFEIKVEGKKCSIT